MEDYQENKNSKVENIPYRYNKTKISRVAYILNGDRGSNYPSGDDLLNEGVPFVSAPDLCNGIIDFTNLSFISKERYNLLRGVRLKANDILYCLRGSVGKNALVTFSEGTIASSLMVIRSLQILPRYLFYVLNSSVVEEQLNVTINGAVTSNLSAENVGKFIIPLLPKDQQKEVISYLDRKTAQIDNIIADKEKLIELLKEKRQAIISEAVTRGLDPAVPTKDSGVDWIGEVPAHWEIKPLFTVAFENKAKNSGNQCTNLLSLSYGKIIKKDIDTNFGLLPESFETYQIVEDGYTILRLTDLQNDKRSLRSGFVSEKGIITSAYVGLIPADDVDGLFLSDLLHAYDLMKIFYSLGNGVRQSMNYKDLKRLPILLPPKSEQKMISNYLRNKTAEIDDLISTAEQQVSLFKEYRQSVISEAVTGKVAIS